MPLYHFKCDTCSKEYKRILKSEDAESDFTCPKCYGKLERNPQLPNTITFETIDNGLQQRRVEQYSEAAKLTEEREENSKKDKKTGL